MLLTALGFTFEIVGILCFAWDKIGIGVSSFALGLTLFCLVTSDETCAWIEFNPIDDLYQTTREVVRDRITYIK